MMRGISRRAMARLAGVSEGAIRERIRSGTLRPLSNGRMNPDDVAGVRMTRRVDTGPDPRTARLLKVRVLGGRVKVQRLRLQIEQLQAETIARESLAMPLRERSRRLVKRIETWSERRGPELAEKLGIDLDTAKGILQRFSALALDELGDIEADALAALRRL
jgi:hypothetical protein